MEALRQSRFVMMLTAEEEQRIQNFRFDRRIGSKAEAARQLIAAGLEKAKGPASAPTLPSHDHDPNPSKEQINELERE